MNIGDKYGRLTVVGVKGARGGLVQAVCDCGNSVELRRWQLRRGNNKSCGCLTIDLFKQRTTKHGHIKRIAGKRAPSAEYRTWQNMRNRCLNPNAQDFKYYGGRGISIDPSWDSFEQFFNDMGPRPSNNHTLDRVDGTKGYSKTNCRWETRQVQARNRPYAKTKTWELAEQLNVKVATAAHYIWKVRAADKNNLREAPLSQELEEKVRAFIKKEKI